MKNALRTITVKVKANAKQTTFEAAGEDGAYSCSVQVAPVGGKANKEVCALAAAHFGVPKARVTVLRGQTSSDKVLAISESDS